MTPEELDKARAKEAYLIWEKDGRGFGPDKVATIAARLAREGWTPPLPADPDLPVVQEVLRDKFPALAAAWGDKNALWVGGHAEEAVLAAYKAGLEAEAERAKVLVEPAEAIVNRAVRGTGSNGARWPHILKAARRLEKGLAAYKAGKEAGK